MIITNIHVEEKYLVPKERLSLLQNRAVSTDSTIDAKMLKSRPLIEILQFMIDIEEKIEKTTLLLLELYKAVDDADREVTISKYTTIRQYISTRKRLEKQRDTVNARPCTTGVCVSNIDYEAEGIYAPVKPIEPVQPSLSKPDPPVLQKPGIFNRKKIDAENAAAQKDYEEAAEKYKLAWEKYQSEQIAFSDSMEKYNRQMEEYNAQCEKVFQLIE